MCVRHNSARLGGLPWSTQLGSVGNPGARDPQSQTLRSAVCAFGQVGAELISHRGQLAGEIAEYREAWFLRQESTGLAENVEALRDDFPSSLAMGKNEKGWANDLEWWAGRAPGECRTD